VVEESEDVLQVAEIHGHVQFVAGKLLGPDREMADPGMAVDVAALAVVTELAVGGVKVAVDADRFQGISWLRMAGKERGEGKVPAPRKAMG
jgi:hypothetical protein